MDIAEKIKQVAASVLRNAISVGPDHDGRFRVQMPFKVGGETKPLVMMGNVHGKAGDGHVVAVLNPEVGLIDEVGTGSSSAVLKETVAGRCDVALDVWIDSAREEAARVVTKYRARKFQSAKFCVA